MLKRLWLVAAVCLVAAPLMVPAGARDPGTAVRGSRPNVVFILTDDMRLDDLRYMPYTRRLFEREGTTFAHALSPHPLCCPARAELVTGQYGQNNGVRHNSGDGGYDGLKHKRRTIFRWFARAGYRSAYIGKYLNGYRGERIAGLTHNDVSVRGVFRARGFVTYNNGDPKVRRVHQTTYVAQRTRRLIRKLSGRRPFLIWSGFVAPHNMQTKRRPTRTVPPKGYGHFRKPGDAIPPSIAQPSFNAPSLAGGREASPKAIRVKHRARVRSLYAVDDSIRTIVRALKRQGAYRNTILVFASDNGMGLGSHREVGKNMPWQDIVRVPLMMAGPGVPKGVNDNVVTLVDVPSTLSRLTRVKPLVKQDGADLFGDHGNRAVLIQAGNQEVSDGWEWRGVYTRRYTFVRWDDARGVSFYDRASDPYELVSHPNAPQVEAFRALLDVLGGCSGQDCQQLAP